MSVLVDLTHYAEISAVRFQVAGEWQMGQYTGAGEEVVVDGCVVVRFSDLDLNSPSAHFCPDEGPYTVELDTFWISWNQTVSDWSFLISRPYEIVVYTTWNGTVTPEIYPGTLIESVTLVVDGVVPNESTPWGAVKTLYR